ncbi:MAG: DUF4350 domain-containing protein [Promethearchaeota archaeon]
MTSPKPPTIHFDTGHNEELALDEPELTELVRLLKLNGMQPVSLTTPLTPEALTKCKVVVLGNPLDSLFTSDEVSALVSFVEAGGGLLIVSGATIFGKGGDVARKTNLNKLAKHFQFEFATKALAQPADISDEVIKAVPAHDHPILAGIGPLFLASGVSLLSEDTKTHLFRAANIPGSPTVAIITEKKEGRVIAFGGGTFFFNDYIQLSNHERLLVQIFRWLSGAPLSLPLQGLSPPRIILDEASATEVIADLRRQLDKIETELSSLKEVINSSVKEMEKLVRQFQDEEKET